jgi:hypothetical protein
VPTGTHPERAVSLYQEVSDRFDESDTLLHLGDTRHAARELGHSREAWQQALAIFDDIQHADPDRVRAKLAGLDNHASQSPSA